MLQSGKNNKRTRDAHLLKQLLVLLKGHKMDSGSMDGLVNGWMDGWIGGWMDGWVDGWIGGWMDRWVGGRMDG